MSLKENKPLTSNTGTAGFTTKNQVNLVRAGKEFFDTLSQMISRAEESIHIQMYIFDEDETGRVVVEALKNAVQRKVAVYLLVDGYASQSLSAEFKNELQAAGIHFRYFEPLFRSRNFYFGRRLHHKLVVVDTRFALVGGVNVSNRYNDLPDQPAWLDFALFVEGEIALPLCVLCWKTWKGYPRHMGMTPCEEKQIDFTIPEEKRIRVRMRRNDWVRRKNEITRTYLQLLSESKNHVTILCSYFLPGRLLRNSLRKALKRGVSIKAIVAGRSDVMLAKRAERWDYDWLLRNGIELYEYQPAILHGKVATADDRWMTIGSFNINDLSTYASIELNLDVDDAGFAKQVREVLEQIIQKDCKQVTLESLTHSRTMLNRLANWTSYHLVRVLYFLFTFYFRQER